MQIVLLGTAAGGGFPQWNCWCPTCRAARADARRAHPRTQSSAAVSVDGQRWFLLNASPDVREQLARLPSGTTAPPGVRFVPVEGVVVTDGELDHTLGLALLREARHLQLYATDAVRAVLERDSKILPVTQAFAEVEVRPLPLGGTTELRYQDGTETGITVQAFAVAGDAPRFASQELDGHTVGLLLRDRTTGGVCAFVPGCGNLDASLLRVLGEANLVLFDGTFWTNDELLALGISERRAHEMGHLPISGPGGSLEQLQALAHPRKVYTHINNSNPVLLEDSPERAAVVAAGLLVGDDGMSFTV